MKFTFERMQLGMLLSINLLTMFVIIFFYHFHFMLIKFMLWINFAFFFEKIFLLKFLHEFSSSRLVGLSIGSDEIPQTCVLMSNSSLYAARQWKEVCNGAKNTEREFQSSTSLPFSFINMLLVLRCVSGWHTWLLACAY